MKLEKPFDTFRVEKRAGEYKDFGSDADYPLHGVRYPTDYGDIAGFTAEDGANLDLFVGTDGNVHGFIKVMRPELPNGEHKFYIHLTEDEEQAVLNEFAPVLLEHGRFDNLEDLKNAIEPYRDGQR